MCRRASRKSRPHPIEALANESVKEFWYTKAKPTTMEAENWHLMVLKLKQVVPSASVCKDSSFVQDVLGTHRFRYVNSVLFVSFFPAVFVN